MSENKSAYKSAFKATSVFGGVQIYNIIIRIIRSKFVAVLLGPSGMGIFGLLNSSVETISALTSFGIGQSAVRNIAEANGSNNQHRLEIVVSVFRRIIWFTGLLGMIICAFFAPYWSQITFGSRDYTFSFVIISVAVLLQQLTGGNTGVLQGLQKYKDLAKANVYGSTAGLLTTVPLYYFWGEKAIVPVLVLTYAISYATAFFLSKKYPIKKVSLKGDEPKAIAKDIIKLGLVMSLSGLLSQLAAYFVRIYINHTGSLDDVGLYNAGFAIVNTYVGLVFTAMATEYYPRLASKVNNTEEYLQTIRQQAEIVLLLLIPLAVAFIVFIRPIILILYSEKFLPVEGMIYWAIAAMIFKALAWPISFGLVTKGNMKAFSICEFSVVAYGFLFNIVGYKLFGLSGLGLSFLLMYLVYFVHMFTVFYKTYENPYGKNVLYVSVFGLLIIAFSLLLKFVDNAVIAYILGGIALGFAILFSYKELDKRIELSKFLKNKKR